MRRLTHEGDVRIRMIPTLENEVSWAVTGDKSAGVELTAIRSQGVVAHVNNMAQQVDPNELPPPIKHKALLNVDLGEAVSQLAE